MKLRHRFFALACAVSLVFVLTCYFGVRLINQPHKDGEVTTIVELPQPLTVADDTPTTTEPEGRTVFMNEEIDVLLSEADEVMQESKKLYAEHDRLKRESGKTTIAIIDLFKEMGHHEEAAELERRRETAGNFQADPLPPAVVKNMDVEYIFRELGLDTSVLELDD